MDAPPVQRHIPASKSSSQFSMPSPVHRQARKTFPPACSSSDRPAPLDGLNSLFGRLVCCPPDSTGLSLPAPGGTVGISMAVISSPCRRGCPGGFRLRGGWSSGTGRASRWPFFAAAGSRLPVAGRRSRSRSPAGSGLSAAAIRLLAPGSSLLIPAGSPPAVVLCTATDMVLPALLRGCRILC